MKNIALFLDVDGVLNQYNHHERIRRHNIYKKSGRNKEFDTFNPFRKKILKLSKLVKQYNIEVYTFSAWRLEELQPFLPFKLVGDTRKWINDMNEISLQYYHSIVIDDEIDTILVRGCKGQDIRLNTNIKTYKTNGDFGLIKKDFVKLNKIFSQFQYTNLKKEVL